MVLKTSLVGSPRTFTSLLIVTFVTISSGIMENVLSLELASIPLQKGFSIEGLLVQRDDWEDVVNNFDD